MKFFYEETFVDYSFLLPPFTRSFLFLVQTFLTAGMCVMWELSWKAHGSNYAQTAKVEGLIDAKGTGFESR